MYVHDTRKEPFLSSPLKVTFDSVIDQGSWGGGTSCHTVVCDA
jgi:hypothetical protein